LSLRGFNSKRIQDFRGAWSLLDGVQVRPNRGFVSQNVRFIGGRVLTRDGFAAHAGVTTAGKVTSAHQWIAAGLHALVYHDNGIVKMLTLPSTVTTLFTLSGAGASVAEAGSVAFVSVFSSTGLGVGQCRVVLPYVVGAPADVAFQPPLTFASFSASEPSAGLTTEGSHKYGFVLTSRTGHIGKPSPAPLDVFTPLTHSCTGLKTVRLSITLNTPAQAGVGSLIQPIMTRSDNPNKWFYVPTPDGGWPILPASATGWTQTFDISVTDEDLANRATALEDDNDAFSYLAQSVLGTGPISPSFVFAYGSRIGYVLGEANINTYPAIYFSEPFKYQTITEDFHKVFMPQRRQIIAAGAIRGTAYLFGPNWTYSCADNGGLPSTWGAPQEVSGAIGTRSPLGACFQTAGDYAWVAAEAGLYLFAGAYDARPVTYYRSDIWKRINWAAATAVQVKDDIVKRQVIVAAPLDAATSASHLIVVDYSRGMTPEDVDISAPDPIGGVSTFGGIAIVTDSTTRKSVLWVGPDAAGSFLKSEDGRRNDNGSMIDWIYETGQLLTAGEGEQANAFGGFMLRGLGGGDLVSTLYGLDRGVSAVAPVIALSSAPAKEYEALVYLSEENFSLRFSASALNSWLDLSSLRPYWMPQRTNR
jgi:hypothetical protein